VWVSDAASIKVLVPIHGFFLLSQMVVVKGGVADCRCNGEVLDAEMKLPPSGPIGLEGDRGQMEYRRIRIKAE